MPVNISIEAWSAIKSQYTLDAATDAFRKTVSMAANVNMSGIKLNDPIFSEVTIPVFDDAGIDMHPVFVAQVSIPVTIDAKYSYASKDMFAAHALVLLSFNYFHAQVFVSPVAHGRSGRYSWTNKAQEVPKFGGHYGWYVSHT